MSPRPAVLSDLSVLPLLALAGFAAGCGMRVLDPLLPLVAGEFGVTLGAASAVIASFALAYGGGQLVVGPLGDRLGKLRVVSFAMLLYGLGSLACGFAFDLSSLVLLRAAAGAVAGGVIPVALAWIGDAVPYGERQATIGRFLVGMVMAQLLAGPAAGILAEFWGWRAPFLLLGAMALLVGALLARRIGATARPPEGGGRGFGLGGYASLLRRPTGRRMLIGGFVDGFCLFGGTFPFIGSYLIEVFGFSPAEAGLVVAGFGLGAFAYTLLARRLVAAAGERGLVLWGGAVLTAAICVYALAADWRLVAALQVVAGLGFYMFHGVLQARATEALPEARATAVSGFALALFLGQSLGSLVFGTIIAAAGYSSGFMLAALCTAGLALWTRAVLLARAPD